MVCPQDAGVRTLSTRVSAALRCPRLRKQTRHFGVGAGGRWTRVRASLKAAEVSRANSQGSRTRTGHEREDFLVSRRRLAAHRRRRVSDSVRHCWMMSIRFEGIRADCEASPGEKESWGLTESMVEQVLKHCEGLRGNVQEGQEHGDEGKEAGGEI